MNALTPSYPALPESLAKVLGMSRARKSGEAPRISVAHTEDGVRIEETLGSHEQVVGLDDLVKDGTLRSYSRDGQTIVAYAATEDAAKKLADLKRESQAVATGSIVDRARELLVPPNMSETVAPEYLRFRAWCLAGSVVSGAIGFMGASVNLDAMKIAFATGANAALAGFANGLVYKVTAMGSSYLAKRGDADPKKWFLASSLINTTNGLLGVGLLAVLPQAYVPLNTWFSVSSAVSNTLGGAAGINVFNHLARGDNKGVVQAKNSNQDMLCDTLGMPVALALSHAASAFGFNPYLVTVGVLGPALAFCNLQAARALHFESIDRTGMKSITDGLVDNGNIVKAPRPGIVQSMRDLIRRKSPPVEDGGRVRLSASLDDAVKAATEGGSRADVLFGLFKDEKYVLACGADNAMTMVFRHDAALADVVKAHLHVNILEKLLDSGVPAMMPDKDRSLLVETAYRALPTVPDSHDLAERGWYPNVEAMQVPRVSANWSGADPQRIAPVSLPDLKSLITSPDATAIAKLLR